jgi:hypothetical protein
MQVATEVLLRSGTTCLCEKKKHFQQWQQLNRNAVTAVSSTITHGRVAVSTVQLGMSRLVPNMQANILPTE